METGGAAEIIVYENDLYVVSQNEGNKHIMIFKKYPKNDIRPNDMGKMIYHGQLNEHSEMLTEEQAKEYLQNVLRITGG